MIGRIIRDNCFKLTLFLLLVVSCLPCYSFSQSETFFVVRSSTPWDRVDCILTEKACDGITIYLGWAKLEPYEGVFDFSKLDSLFSFAKVNNKKINLAILTGRWCPKWLKEKDDISYMRWSNKDTFTENGSVVSSEAPIPWNPSFRFYFSKVLVGLKNHLNEKEFISSVNYLVVTGGSNTNGIEANMIADDSELLRIGFSRTVYERNWISLYLEFVKVFPGIKLAFAVHEQFGSFRDNLISKRIISEIERVSVNPNIMIAGLAFTEEPWFSEGNSYYDLCLSRGANCTILQSIRIYGSNYNKFRNLMYKSLKVKPAVVEIWAEDYENWLKFYNEFTNN